MLLYPKVQARAREEIDRVISEGRSPDFSDQEKMPYTRAVVLETFRWNPPAPLGTSRQISRDPKIYEDPSVFNPERFINNPNILDPRDFIFGFGRRICPGNYLAYQITWIFVVSILRTFELKRPEGEPDLENITEADLFELGFIRCAFIPRETAVKRFTSARD
ncbi:hypothetical protein FRC00_005487 [Tulasnella sp. 408]|nr:hypothetical protein FRC00_005487 [Tulasnella sp. 408]